VSVLLLGGLFSFLLVLALVVLFIVSVHSRKLLWFIVVIVTRGTGRLVLTRLATLIVGLVVIRFILIDFTLLLIPAFVSRTVLVVAAVLVFVLVGAEVLVPATSRVTTRQLPPQHTSRRRDRCLYVERTTWLW